MVGNEFHFVVVPIWLYRKTTRQFGTIRLHWQSVLARGRGLEKQQGHCRSDWRWIGGAV